MRLKEHNIFSASNRSLRKYVTAIYNCLHQEKSLDAHRFFSVMEGLEADISKSKTGIRVHIINQEDNHPLVAHLYKRYILVWLNQKLLG